MNADIYNIDNIRKVYRYLEYTFIANSKDREVLNLAAKRIRKGQPLTDKMEKEVRELFSLYRGMTLD